MKNGITPKELWDEFESAANQIPGGLDLDDESWEHGQPAPYGKLKRRYDTVISYWMDDTTRGGHILWETGYHACLDEGVVEMVEEYQRELNKAKKEIVAKVFGGRVR